MKKIYATMLLALVSLTAFAQEPNDTTYVMFDFNLNPWNHATTGVGSGWNPNYSDPAGFITAQTAFDWPVTEGSDKKISVVVAPPADYDPEEGTRVPLMFKGPNYDEAMDGSVIETMLWMNPNSTVRFKAPEGYKFGKMVFYFYRNSYFVLDTEEEIKEGDFNVKHYIWIPTTPKINKNELETWQGDEKDILFDYFDIKCVFRRIDMRLVPDGSAGINNLRTDGKDAEKTYTLDGREVNKANGLPKGVYIKDGKKVIVK
jgi:hypothetical protein